MKNLKRLEHLEKCSERLCKSQFDREFASWLEQNPPQHITINPNSHDEWLNNMPAHFKASFEKWSEDIRSYVQYMEKHIYRRLYHS